MRKILLFSSGIGLFLVAFGFSMYRSATKLAEIEPPPVVSPAFMTTVPLTPSLKPTADWTVVDKGIEVRALSYPYGDTQYDIQVVKLDPKQVQLSLEYDPEGKTISSWGKGVDGLVMNAGFFKEENKPVGLLYINSIRKDNHRIRPAGTGLLVLNVSGISILDLSKTAVPPDDVLENAVQAYPMLISQGQLVAKTSLEMQARRTAIGSDKVGNVYLFTAQYPHLGLYDFAKLIHDSPLSLTEVLNLDGGGSTGIAINTAKYKEVIDSQTLIPTVLKARKK